MTTVLTETKVTGMTATSVWPTLATFVSHHAPAIAAALALAAAVAVLVAWKRGATRRLLIAASFTMSLAINAEGMWVVATQKLKLPAVFAAGVFSVFEIILLTEMSLAADHYRRTTVRDDAGRIVKAGHPGKHGRTVFAIAATSGVIVAFNAGSLVEVLLRLALPVAVTVLWWNVLTAEGTGRPLSRFAWTPRRVAERLGLLVADVDDNLDALARERRIRAIVNVEERVAGKVRPVSFHVWRLARLARLADDDMIDEAALRLARVRQIRARLSGAVKPSLTSDVTAEVAAAEAVSGVPTEDVTADVTSHLPEDVSEDLTEDRTEDVSDTSQGTSPSTPPKTSPKPNATALKIAKVRVRYPDLTQAQVAKRAEVSLSTAQRYWPITAPAAEPTKTNGHAMPGLIPTGGMS